MRPIGDRLSATIKWLVVINTLFFLLYLFARPLRYVVSEYLALGPNLLAGMAWQPVTALFFHVDPLSFGFNILGLWFVGATVERMVPRARFWMIFFLPAVLGGVVEVAVGTLTHAATISAGCGPAVLGLFVAFGVRHGQTPARILGGLVMEARLFTAILIGFSLLVSLASGLWGSAAGTLLTSAIAFVLIGGKRDDLRGIFSRGGGVGTGGSPPRARRKYAVLDGGLAKPGKGARGKGGFVN
jgi:membrane associated rhomboid family serine protease